MSTAHPRALIEAMHLLEESSPEFSVGLTNHGPMALEALSRLDPTRCMSFVGHYMQRLRPIADEPDPSLADFQSETEQTRREIERRGYREALEERSDALAQRMIGAAFHGLIRVAHAARALALEDHPVFRHELAAALTYARVRGASLGVHAHSTDTRTLTLDEAIAQLEPSPEALVHAPGLITPTLVSRATAHPRLVETAQRVVLDQNPSAAARALRSAATRLLARGEFHPASEFTLLHGVTAMDAVVTMTALVSEERAKEWVRQAKLGLLAVRVAYVGRAEKSEENRAPSTHTLPLNVLRHQAARSLDDHAIKLAAALDERDDPDASLALSSWLRAVESS